MQSIEIILPCCSIVIEITLFEESDILIDASIALSKIFPIKE